MHYTEVLNRRQTSQALCGPTNKDIYRILGTFAVFALKVLSHLRKRRSSSIISQHPEVIMFTTDDSGYGHQKCIPSDYSGTVKMCVNSFDAYSAGPVSSIICMKASLSTMRFVEGAPVGFASSYAFFGRF